MILLATYFDCTDRWPYYLFPWLLNLKILGLVTSYLPLLHQTPFAKIISFSTSDHLGIPIQDHTCLQQKISIFSKSSAIQRLSTIKPTQKSTLFSLTPHLQESCHLLESIFYSRTLRRKDNIPSKSSSLVLLQHSFKNCSLLPHELKYCYSFMPPYNWQLFYF